MSWKCLPCVCTLQYAQNDYNGSMCEIMTTIPGYYTIQEAADVLGKSRSMVCRYVTQELLPAKNLGNQMLIEQSEVHTFVPPPRGNPAFRKDKSPKSLPDQ